jgi:hypothetical protein
MPDLGVHDAAISVFTMARRAHIVTSEGVLAPKQGRAVRVGLEPRHAMVLVDSGRHRPATVPGDLPKVLSDR